MSTRFDRSRSAWILAVLLLTLLVPSAGRCEENEDSATSTSPVNTVASVSEQKAPLRFSFEGVAWREVIRWIADEAELALQFGELPTGSFTYSDPNEYSHQEAIDRINLFLLPQGFTLVRSGGLLSVINLGDPRSIQQLDALADLVRVEQLDQRQNHEVVKCLFPLGELAAEDAVQELSALNLMTTPAVFSKTNQLMITDTAVKLKNVKQILDAFQPSEMANGTVVESFSLQYADAEDVLVVARPHLGLATGEMIGIDVSLSADVLGKHIFVTGVEDKVKLIAGLVEAIDKPETSSLADAAPAELRSHFVEGGNVETVYNVLQTLLAGKSVRLSMDETAGSVVALAPPSVQAEIEATVVQLQASDADFEVIPLKTVDPYLAISLLEEMLDLPDEFADPDEIDPDAPKIDADPANMRLYVRAKKHQIDQIKKIVAGLDSNGTASDREEIRIFPLQGKNAEAILEMAAKFWRGDNPVILYRSTIDSRSEISERVVGAQSGGQTLTANNFGNADADLRSQRWLTANADSEGPAIRCQVTARGLLLQSDDPDALDKFEEHLRTIIGPTDTVPSPPVVFYLKYTKPDDALRLLAELLDGGESVTELSGASLVNGYVSSATDSFLGSIVTSRDGTTTMLAGSITVVADSRLNRLIAQGTENDIERIESYLSIIDKDNSITDIETYGSSHVIELYNSRASEVAAALRDAFASRVTAASGPGQPGKPGSPQAQSEAAAKAAAAKREPDTSGKKPSDKKAVAGRPAKDLEPKMTIAVHEPSNSLIVTAPEQLFVEVEKLARSIDSRGEQAIEVIAPINGELIELVLQQVLLGESPTARRSPLSSSAASRPNPSTSSRSKSDR